MSSAGQALLDRMKLTKDKIEYIKLQGAYQFRKSGIESFVSKPRGGRRWSYMTLEEEKRLLDELSNDAIKGIVVISKVVRYKAEEKLGRAVSADYAEDLLNRHGWRKIAPRPKHPKSSKKEQEEFKKKCQILSKK